MSDITTTQKPAAAAPDPDPETEKPPPVTLWDFVERAGWSAGQQFVAILLAAGTAGSVLQLPWALAGAMAAGAALVSAVATAVQYLTKRLTSKSTRTFKSDLILRLIKTFLVSLGASFGADVAFNVLTFNWSEALGIAFLTTIGALGKGMLARQAGEGNNPSTLRPALYAARYA